jgi:hypothetical protein
VIIRCDAAVCLGALWGRLLVECMVQQVYTLETTIVLPVSKRRCKSYVNLAQHLKRGMALEGYWLLKTVEHMPAK